MVITEVAFITTKAGTVTPEHGLDPQRREQTSTVPLVLSTFQEVEKWIMAFHIDDEIFSATPAPGMISLREALVVGVERWSVSANARVALARNFRR
jgi:hypothetical protein